MGRLSPPVLLSILLTTLATVLAVAIPHTARQGGEEVRAIYVFSDPLIANNTAIKSGFNTALVFEIEVDENANLKFYGKDGSQTILASNGIYTGGSAYSDVVSAYKTGSTSITRTEVSLLSGTVTWQSIKNLVNNNGTSTNSILARNFAALKAAWNIDAINNDDEAVYDHDSTVAFTLMMGRLGYQNSLVPYENQDYWAGIISSVNAQSPGLIDRVYLQCYSGGEGNDPGQWQSALNFKVIPLLWVVNQSDPEDGSTPTEVQTLMQTWKTVDGVVGGGLWNNAGEFNCFVSSL